MIGEAGARTFQAGGRQWTALRESGVGDEKGGNYRPGVELKPPQSGLMFRGDDGQVRFLLLDEIKLPSSERFAAFTEGELRDLLAQAAPVEPGREGRGRR